MSMATDKERILGILQNATTPLSTREVSDRVGINWANTKKILQTLYKEKAVKWEKVKNRNLWQMAENNKKPFTGRITKDHVEKIPETTIKMTGHALRYLLAIVAIYLIISMLWLIYTKKEEFIDSIVLWSIGGFWAFFMGYFGWILAEQITNSFTNKVKRRKEKTAKKNGNADEPQTVTPVSKEEDGLNS